jgi:hypothetical protein
MIILLFLAVLAVEPVYSQTVTFFGRVTDQNTGLGLSDVAVVATGNQTGTRVAVTNSQGDYTLQLGTNTNIRLRAYRTNFVFNPALVGFSSIGGPITGSHPLDFSGTALPFSILIFPQGPILLTEDNSLQALILDSVFHTRDPFTLTNGNYFGTDKQTRLKLLLVDVDLYNAETLSIFSVQAVDSSQVAHDLQVEDLQKVPGTPWMSQLTVRLPSDIPVPNQLRVTVTARGLASNEATIRVH